VPHNLLVENALVLVLVAVLAIGGAAVSERIRVPAPLLLIVVGVAVSFVPGLTEVHLSSEVVLLGLLPPLLYSAAIQTSLVDVRAIAGTVGLLSVGLVVVTTLVVGAVLVTLAPELGWPLALAAGAVVAPPDAVAATAVARRIGLPRRVVTILEAESLFNDATALVALRTALAALVGGLGVWRIGGDFLLAAVGGAVVGVGVFVVVAWLRRRITDPLVDTGISFVTPYAAYLLAEEIHASGVIALVVAGFLLALKAPIVQTASSRITERITWQTVAFVLENAVFLLLGLQVRTILGGIAESELGLGTIAGLCAAGLVTVMLVRPAWVLAVEWLRDLGRAERDRWPVAERVVVSWAGMRGVVTVAAALLVPEGTPYREVVILVAMTTVLGTLFLQGLSLSWLARRLRVQGPDPAADALARATLLQQAAVAGLHRMEELEPDDSTGVATMIRRRVDQRSFAAWERLSTAQGQESPSEQYSRVRLEMLEAERARVLEIRDKGKVPSDIVREVLGMLDLEESMLDYSTEERERIADAGDLVGRGPGCAELRAYPVSGDGPATECALCAADGGTAVALRRCLVCGYVGCCDSSPGQHATAHFLDTGHPVMESAEPGESWRWCYVHHVTG